MNMSNFTEVNMILENKKYAAKYMIRSDILSVTFIYEKTPSIINITLSHNSKLSYNDSTKTLFIEYKGRIKPRWSWRYIDPMEKISTCIELIMSTDYQYDRLQKLLSHRGFKK